MRQRLCEILVLVVCVLTVSSLAFGWEERTWDGGGDGEDWFDPINWDPNGGPGRSDRLDIYTGSPVADSPVVVGEGPINGGRIWLLDDSVTVTLDVLTVYRGSVFVYYGATLSTMGCSVGTGDEGSFSVLHGSSWYNDGELYIGSNHESDLVINGGAQVTCTGPVSLASGAGGAGSWIRVAGSDTVFSITDDLYVGVGKFEQYGGPTVEVDGYISVGGNNSVTGTYDLDGGLCSVGGDVRIAPAYRKDGALTIDKTYGTQSTLDVGGSLYVPYYLDEYNITDALLEIRDDSASIAIAGDLSFANGGVFTVAPGENPTITMDGATSKLLIDADADATDLAGLGALTLEFSGDEEGTGTREIEVAGEDPDPNMPEAGDFSRANFVINELIVGSTSTTGPVTLSLLDLEDNQGNGGSNEALYVKTLTIKPCGTFSLGRPLYYLNGGSPKKLYVADANLDGAVGVIDNWILNQNYNGVGKSWAEGDTNGDRRVDIVDLTAYAANAGSGEPDVLSGYTITVSESSEDTTTLPGYKTITVSISTDDDLLVGFDLEFETEGTMNQVNPYGMPTVFEDLNFGFPFVGASVDQDSQFKFNSNDLTVASGSESSTTLAAEFMFDDGGDDDDAGTVVILAQVVVPSGDEVTLSGTVILADDVTKEILGHAIVSATINEQ